MTPSKSRQSSGLSGIGLSELLPHRGLNVADALAVDHRLRHLLPQAGREVLAGIFDLSHLLEVPMQEASQADAAAVVLEGDAADHRHGHPAGAGRRVATFDIGETVHLDLL